VNFTKRDTGKFSFVYGHGIENYMNDAPVDVSVKNNSGNPKGVALPVLGVVSFLDHNWSDRFSTAIGYSMMNIYNSDGQTSKDFHQGHYALANLLYHPIPKVTIGSEFQFGRRLNFSHGVNLEDGSQGFNANDYRVQFSFKYDWGKSFQF
jgi:hypothetical protein